MQEIEKIMLVHFSDFVGTYLPNTSSHSDKSSKVFQAC